MVSPLSRLLPVSGPGQRHLSARPEVALGRGALVGPPRWAGSAEPGRPALGWGWAGVVDEATQVRSAAEPSLAVGGT